MAITFGFPLTLARNKMIIGDTCQCNDQLPNPENFDRALVIDSSAIGDLAFAPKLQPNLDQLAKSTGDDVDICPGLAAGDARLVRDR